MARSYSYSIFVKDFMSSKLMKIAQTAGTTYNKFNQYQSQHQNQLLKSGRKVDALRNKLSGIQKQKGILNATRQIKKLNKELNRSNNLVRSLKSTAIGVFGTLGVISAVKGISKLGLDLEQTRIKFETLLGSAEKANAMIASLNKFANQTPFENADLQRNAELLLNFGISGNKILPTLKMLGDVSGGNKEKLNALSLAYAQVQSTGKLMGQDLLQMINAGFNPLQIISEKTGVSIGKLKEQMSKGQISAKLVENAFALATSKGGRFYGMMSKISQSGWGKLSTFFGNLKTKLAEFSEQYIVPAINKIIDFGIKLIDGFSKIKNAVLNVFNALAPLWNALTSFIAGLLGVTEASVGAEGFINRLSATINALAIGVEILSNGIITVLNWLKPLMPVLKVVLVLYGLWTIAQVALNIAMTANPIGLIITAIVALIGAIVYAYQKVGWFRGGILAIWETIKGFGNLIKDAVVNRIKEFISGITGLGKTLLLFFKGEWSKAWEAGKQATKDLIGVGTAQKTIAQAKKVGKDAAKAYQKGVNEAANNKGSSVIDKLIPKTPKITNPNTNGLTSLDGGGLANSGAFKDGVNGITGGGSKQTNINVTFDKLIENMIIKSETISEGIDDMEDRVKEALMRIMNSTNHLQTQSV